MTGETVQETGLWHWGDGFRLDYCVAEEQRNREAMEQNGYTEESYEAWRDNASERVGIPDMELPWVDELVNLMDYKNEFLFDEPT